MSKIFAIFLIIFLQTIIFPIHTYAVNNCNDSNIGIQLSQNFFPENVSPVLNFSITNGGTSSNLQGKKVFFRQFNFFGFAYSDSQESQPISGDSFSITINTNDLKSTGAHSGSLFTGSSEICSYVSYQIGATGSFCYFDQNYLNNTPIVPGGQITIRFVGKKNTEFHLKPNGGGSDLTGPVTTGDDGQGSFDNVTINGNNGDTVGLLITDNNFIQSCHPSVKLSISAPPPGSPPPGPITPSPFKGTASVCTTNPLDSSCSLAGGITCGSSDNPAISTAIGCIHTSPSGFVKDFLTFIIGISGGLAFLMMLLGAFQMLTSAGNPDTLNAGRDRLTSAAIGLLFVIFAVLLLQIIGFGILNIPGFKP